LRNERYIGAAGFAKALIGRDGGGSALWTKHSELSARRTRVKFLQRISKMRRLRKIAQANQKDRAFICAFWTLTVAFARIADIFFQVTVEF
jgi:hypothetical protein